MINGVPVADVNAEGSIGGSIVMVPGETAEIVIRYRSQGLDRWTYNFHGQPAHIRDFDLNMTTNFRAIDFPENTLSPVKREETVNGWRLNWNYSSLVTSYAIAMEMPRRLQPGPLAGQISYFAPVSLFFFFFLMFIITTVRNIDLHPMNYFFLATAFFAFHLLLAYLVDHVSVHTSFMICSLVSIFLVVSYLRLVVNMRFAVVEAAGAQFVFLVLFSYAFFFQGFTGLAITIGAIVTLFVVMQLTGRVNWEEKFWRT
jgi:inner membrane protein involved in colicin E2 resistance